MNDIENLIKYVKDHSNNFLSSKATLKENETFEYMYDLLIETLEKQIPKNVIIENGWKYCPACYECINDDYGTETNYCSDCGQRLEW